jgi:hypothetical protein
MAFRMIRNEREDIGKELDRGTRFHWSSIFAGAFATLGFALFFLLLGNGIGLSINNALNPAVTGGLKAVSWVYMVVTMTASYYLGSLCATRPNDEIKSRAEGGLHGVITWALASVLGAFFAARAGVTAGDILNGVGPNAGNWLAIFVMGLGFAAAISGGMSVRTSARRETRVEEEEEREEERKEELKKTA